MVALFFRTAEEAHCYGCRACEQVCPKHAISIECNAEGFLYPKIEPKLCIDCSLCFKSCPYENDLLTFSEPKRAIALQYKNVERLKNASSGGAFPALADYFLSKGGEIAGCIFDDDINAIHILSGNFDVVKKMSGSKYVQSNLDHIYSTIKSKLDSSKTILFTGTPCQIAGLKTFLKKDYDNLYTVDLICHGVPSPLLLKDYLESTYNGKIIDLRFRDKSKNGWASAGSITISTSKNRRKRITPFNDSYYYYYIKNMVNRMSCYSCRFATTNRIADLTIGDFWNVDYVLPEIKFISKGISAVLINTDKGNKLIEEISSNIYYEDTTIENIVKSNPNLQNPTPMPIERSMIYKKIKENGYLATAKDECSFSYLMPFIKRIIPYKIKRIIKYMTERGQVII